VRSGEVSNLEPRGCPWALKEDEHLRSSTTAGHCESSILFTAPRPLESDMAENRWDAKGLKGTQRNVLSYLSQRARQPSGCLGDERSSSQKTLFCVTFFLRATA